MVADVHSNSLNIRGAEGFPSTFLGNTNHTQRLLDLMTGHFNNSLEYLFTSKFYGSQFSERPGMAKLLAEESDRHWEEGMDVLKKYLQIGGTTDGVFPTSMNFKVETNMFTRPEALHDKYKDSLKSVMEDSRRLVNAVSDLYHDANHRPSSHGDADVAHFLQEKAEEEAAVARKMVGHYITIQKMSSFGMALDIFDKNL